MSKTITGHTGLLCLLGSPVEHSISPQMHNEACKELGLDYTYLAFDVQPDQMEQAIQGLKAMGVRGWNITMPNKNIMARLADRRSTACELIGACNTIVNENGILHAHTTDGTGFIRALADQNISIASKTMTLMGAGGAAMAILVQSALDGAACIHVFNVRDSFFLRLEEIARKLNETTDCKVIIHDFDSPEELKQAIEQSSILVNGTSVGMGESDKSLIEDMSLFRPDLFVFDVIYNPAQTRLLKDASAHGCKTDNGLGMLLHQGAASFELWTGQKMPVEHIKKTVFDSHKEC